MVLMDHILSRDASVNERLVASQVEHILSLDTERLRHLWNPWACHPDDLPYLAWALSVDIWDSDWPIEKKRSVVAHAVHHHRIKGTLAGLETYLALVDVTIERVLTPATKVFSGPSLTVAEREAWLSGLPQVRLYYTPEPAEFQSSTWSGGISAKSFTNLDFLVPTTAPRRLSRRAAYVVDGQETAIKVDRDGTEIHLLVPGARPDSAFCGTVTARSYMGLDHLMPSTAAERVVSIAPVSLSPWRTPVGPSLQPVSSRPEQVATPGEAGPAVFCNDGLIGRFFLPSTAKHRVYERYAIDDGRAVQKRPAFSFMGMERFGVPGHTAEVRVRIRSRKPEIQAGEGAFIPRSTFWLPHNPKPLEQTCQAANAARRASDTILLDTKTAAGFFAGLPFIAGRDSFVV